MLFKIYDTVQRNMSIYANRQIYLQTIELLINIIYAPNIKFYGNSIFDDLSMYILVKFESHGRPKLCDVTFMLLW